MAERERRVPYLATAAALLAFVALSASVPWSSVHFPADLPPLFLNWQPLVGPGIVAPVLLCAALVSASPHLLRLRVRWLLAVLVLFTALTSATLAMQAGQVRLFRGCCLPGSGTALIAAPFERDGEYFAAVPLVDELGPRTFAERFDELTRTAGALPVHVQTHPPGAPMFLWLLAEATGGGSLAVALAVVAIGAFGVLPTYAIARAAYGAAAARAAAVLFACAPGVLVYSATSMDVVFMTAVGSALALLIRAPAAAAWAAGAGVAAAIAMCLTWGALALGPIGLGIGLLAVRAEGARAVVTNGLVAFGSFIVSLLVLRVALGIDLVSAFGATLDRHTRFLTYDRSRGYWLLGNVVALLVTAGLATSALLVAETRERWRRRSPGLETVLWVTVLASSALGVFRGETDHNWLFFLPLLVSVAAASAARIRPPVASSSVQAIATDALFYTGW